MKLLCIVFFTLFPSFVVEDKPALPNLKEGISMISSYFQTLYEVLPKLIDAGASVQLKNRLVRVNKAVSVLRYEKQKIMELIPEKSRKRSRILSKSIEAIRESTEQVRNDIFELSAELRLQKEFDGQKFAFLMFQDINGKILTIDGIKYLATYQNLSVPEFQRKLQSELTDAIRELENVNSNISKCIILLE